MIKLLTEEDYYNLLELLHDTPHKIGFELIKHTLSGELPEKPCTLSYGVYSEERLISFMMAEYCDFFDSGIKVCSICQAYTRPDKRRQGHAESILQVIEAHAREYFHVVYLNSPTLELQEYFKARGFEEAKYFGVWKRLR